MSRRPVVILAGVALAGSVLVAAPAEAATYGVTLTLSKTSVDVGQKIGLSGKVSGAKATRKKLTIQYRVGSGTWATAKTVTTTSKATYATTVTVSGTGLSSLRVVAPKAGSTKTGTSPTKSFTGWRWLWLHQQTASANGSFFFGPITHQGAVYSHSIRMSGSSGIIWGLNQQCDRLSASVAAPTSGDPQAPQFSQPVSVSTSDQSGTVDAEPGSPKSIDAYVTPSSRYLSISRTSTGTDIYVLSPKVHCSVDELTPSDE